MKSTDCPIERSMRSVSNPAVMMLRRTVAGINQNLQKIQWKTVKKLCIVFGFANKVQYYVKSFKWFNAQLHFVSAEIISYRKQMTTSHHNFWWRHKTNFEQTSYSHGGRFREPKDAGVGEGVAEDEGGHPRTGPSVFSKFLGKKPAQSRSHQMNFLLKIKRLFRNLKQKD
jgi:hypothetical protein